VEPLLLVQVGNGDEAVDEARRDLMELCKVPADAIGVHSAAEPDPVLMASIANDSTKKVLVFKQSAGTGFDAPRAFVLASTKPVNDADFATQFIGRVMRVLPQLRARFPKPQLIPVDLDTAFVYLANAEAQTGFQQSVDANAKVKSELQGQTEPLTVRQTFQGGYAITNRPSAQAPVLYDLPLPSTVLGTGTGELPVATRNSFGLDTAHATTQPVGTQTGLLFGADDDHDDIELDELQPVAAPAGAPRITPLLSTPEAIVQALSERGLHAYRLRKDLPALPRALMREERPVLADMSSISEGVANRLELPESVRTTAIAVALNRVKGIERTTELTTGVKTEAEVAIVTDRVHLAADARAALKRLPQTEEADHAIIVERLSLRLLAAIEEKFEDVEDIDRPDVKSLRRYARDAAYWVVLKQFDLLEEMLFDEIAKQSRLVESGPLPDAMLFPSDVSLDHSAKNIYGVRPPNKDQTDDLQGSLLVDSSAWFGERVYPLQSGESFTTSPYDGASKLNGFEREIAEALDRAPFVRWWHRNADRKPYKVSVVRAEHKHYFYPDFVVCMEHSPGDAPLQRLIETKDNTKDAARKARHTPQFYGSVLFITQDQRRIKIINRDGSLGQTIDTDDLASLQDNLRSTRPTV
jgi:hypothetical protein